MRQVFDQLAERVMARVQPGEIALVNFKGEAGDFVRFNHGRIRQAGNNREASLTINLASGDRHASAMLTLSGEPGTDGPALDAQVARLREILPALPPDPHRLIQTEPRNTERAGTNALPPGPVITEALLTRAQGLDLVGIQASGAIHSGFANSLGQRNWFTSHSFHLDWSLYDRGDKAVKSSYAGFKFDPAILDDRMARARRRLELLGRPAKTIPPGSCRAYFTPAAVADLAGLVCRGGFGEFARRVKASPLTAAAAGRHLSPLVSLYENTAGGIGPDFQDSGFVKPDRVCLMEGGECQQTLVSPRTARKYGIATNGAGRWEFPEALEMAPGSLDADKALGALGTGVWVGHVHYLNYSDMPQGRITGMTRFATFWVENGEVVAPLNVMRFDDTVYRFFGEHLSALTSRAELVIEERTYAGRSTHSARVPGALIDDFRFTL